MRAPRARLWLAGLLLAGGLMGVGLRRWATPRAAERWDLLLVTVDTLRADALGAYGQRPSVTPTMDELARAGVRFADAHAHAVMTLPAHASLLTGLYPHQHGVRDNAGFRLPQTLETLATRLRAAGYRTGAFVSAFPLDSRFGLARGFDVYDDDLPDARASAFLEAERPGRETVARALRFKAAGAGPTFVWVHVYEPHFPYGDGDGATRNAYLRDVAAADACLRPLLEPLLAEGRAGRTLVALTSDHGESLGEHGESTHGLLAYEATLRVPLILHAPRLDARVVTTPARHVDLVPTLLDALGLAVPSDFAGRSLWPAARGARLAPASSYFEALTGALTRGWAPLIGVIANGHKYVDTPLPELYDLDSDPGETENRLASDARLGAPLRAELLRLRAQGSAAAPAPRVEGADVRGRLASLGYLGGDGDARPSSAVGDDPKRRIVEETRLQELVTLALSGRVADARERARVLARERPGSAMVFLHLAQLEREGGGLPAAIAALRRAQALRPRDTLVLSRLAAYMTEAGQAAEAAALLEPAARAPQPDVDVLTTRALALARTSQTDAALQELARARASDPDDARILLHSGTVRLLAGQRAAARADFEAARARRPELAAAWTALGVLALEDGQESVGIDHLRQALSLDAREGGKLVALAAGLMRGGRERAGRACLELFLASDAAQRHPEQARLARRWLAGGA